MDNQPATTGQPPGTDDAPWDEARIEQAMKRLKLLHIKVRLLRDTIPKMINPLVQKQPSPDAMFSAFMKAVEGAQADVKDFTDLMRDEVSKDVFDQVNKSQRESPLGIKPWRHKDYPDWFTMDTE